MSANFSRYVTYLIMAIVLFAGFSIHNLLGIAAVVAMIGWLLYNKRDGFYLQKALNENAKGNTKEALELLEKAYQIGPGNSVLATNYAYLALKSGDFKKADQLLEKVQQDQLGKQRNNFEMTLALVRWKQGRLQEAVEMLERIHSHIKNTTLYGSLGYLYIEQGNLEQALAYNLEAYDYNDTDAVIMDNLFLTHILREEWEQAEDIGAKLLSLNPKFPEAYYHDALLKLHNGDYSGALEQLDNSLSRTFTAVSTESRETVERKREETAALLEQ